MDQELENIRKRAEEDITATTSLEEWDATYLKYFSKAHGILTLFMKKLPDLSIDEKKRFGPIFNQTQNALKTLFENKKTSLQEGLLEDPMLDMSFPEPALNIGYMHPINQAIEEINSFFRYYGFSIGEGPEIETAENNFRKLNLPEGHPATDLQDTLFVQEPDLLLRTHTSSIESRILTDYKPPIRVVVPGKVFRNETASATNLAFFHQYQGFVVDKGVTIQHLKGILESFHKFLFGQDVVLRFRYKYYPEVSPGMGTDMQCSFCKGKGCTVCKQRGWIEVLGSGMIHYNTLKMCGIDPEVYTGFAFGLGLDRLVMNKFGIDDIRKLYGGGLIYV